MRIALDARSLCSPTHATAAAARRTLALYESLLEARPDWRVYAYRTAAEGPTLLDSRPFTQRIVGGGPRGAGWRWRWPMSAWRDGADAMHCPHVDLPAFSTGPLVAGVDDLHPLDGAAGLTVEQVSRYQDQLASACRRADWLVCPTCHVRDRLVRDYRAETSRVTVNPYGGEPGVAMTPQGRWPAVLQRYNISRPYVLHLDAWMRGSNTRKVIEAWAMAPAFVRQKMQLVIMGVDEATGRDLLHLIDLLGMTGSVRIFRFAEHDDLPALLSAADILLQPALGDAYPQTLLNAWATQAAVIGSDVPVMRELADDAAVLVDATDACAMGRALARLVKDARYRADLVERGKRRLERYTWRAAGERLARCFERALERRTPKRRAA